MMGTDVKQEGTKSKVSLDIDQLKVRSDEFNRYRKFILDNLEPNVDYVTYKFRIANQRGGQDIVRENKVLTKAGAEKIAYILGYRILPDSEEEREYEDGHYEILVKVKVFNPDGGLIGYGLGSANTREKRYQGDPWGSRNTVVKMAKKRAFVSGIIDSAGLSALFTQDFDEEG